MSSWSVELREEPFVSLAVAHQEQRHGELVSRRQDTGGLALGCAPERLDVMAAVVGMGGANHPHFRQGGVAAVGHDSVLAVEAGADLEGLCCGSGVVRRSVPEVRADAAAEGLQLAGRLCVPSLIEDLLRPEPLVASGHLTHPGLQLAAGHHEQAEVGSRLQQALRSVVRIA